MRLDGLERDSVDARRPVIPLGQPIRLTQRLLFANVNIQSPETPGRFRLRLDVYLPSQVLQSNRCLYHLTLAFHIDGTLTDSRAPSLHGHYSASSLVRTRP